MSIAENVARIKAEMAAAAIAAGRDPKEILLCAATKMNDSENVRQAIAAGRDPKSILLCAATKMNDADAVREAIRCGVDCCGENRVQELTSKLADNAYQGAPVHFIGHLQTNKVKQVVGKVDLIQSVDSERLLRAIDRKSTRLNSSHR